MFGSSGGSQCLSTAGPALVLSVLDVWGISDSVPRCVERYTVRRVKLCRSSARTCSGLSWIIFHQRCP